MTTSQRIADALRMHAHPHLTEPVIREALRNENRPLIAAIQQAVKEMENRPADDIEHIWNEAFDAWELPLYMDADFNIHDIPEK